MVDWLTSVIEFSVRFNMVKLGVYYVLCGNQDCVTDKPPLSAVAMNRGCELQSEARWFADVSLTLIMQLCEAKGKRLKGK